MKKQLILTLVLIAIYFFSLHPYSGSGGGIFFLLTGWAIPTILNLSITYFLVILFFDKLSKRIKYLAFIATSFIIGVNIKLVDIFDFKVENHKVNIVKPLHTFTSSSIFTPEFHEINLKTSPFDSFKIGGDKGCMCLYFEPPISLLESSIKAMIDINDQSHNNLISRCFIPEYATHQITYESKLIKRKVYLKTTIRDQREGHIVIESIYPSSLVFINEFEKIDRAKILDQPFFWKHVSLMLINRNFWQKILTNIIYYKSPINALLKLDRDSYIIPDSYPRWVG